MVPELGERTKGVAKVLAEAIARARERDDPYLEGLVVEGEALEAPLDLTYFELHDVELVRCNLAGIDLTKASLYDCTLKDCDLANADLTEAFLARSRLVGCKLEGAALRGAYLRSCRLLDCQCRYLGAGEAKLEATRLVRCDLTEAFLSEVKLVRGSRLEACDLTRADLFRTRLSGVDLTTCEIAGIQTSESHAELRGARIALEQAPIIAAMLGVRIEGFD